MEYKLIDYCRIEWTDGRPDTEQGHVRINGDYANVSAWEHVEDKVTTSDGVEHGVELRPTGRTVQLERITGLEMREGKKGELVLQGFRTIDGRVTETPISLRIFPDMKRCASCG